MGRWRKTLPLLFSVGLISWLVSRISVDNLWRAAAAVRWQLLLLVPVTAAMVVLVYLWDAYCLPIVFASGNARLSYGCMLRLRGRSYLLSALNQGLGQAAIAWSVVRIQGMPLLAGLSRSIVLACHDGFVLSTAALAGSLMSDNPQAAHVRPFCTVMLAALLGAALFLGVLPTAWRRRVQQTRWGAWLDGWTWRTQRPLDPFANRLFCHPGKLRRGCFTNLLPGGCPCHGVGHHSPGLDGQRPSQRSRASAPAETALYLLLPTGRPDVLLAMGLIWSTGMLVVRLGIGFAWLCLSKCGNGPPARLGGTDISPVAPMAGGRSPAPPVAPTSQPRFSEVPQ